MHYSQIQKQETSRLSDTEHEILKKWYKKRKINMFITYFNVCMYQFEYGSIVISAFFYFKNTLKVDNPNLYYSLTLGAMYLLVPLSSAIVGKYTDKTRDLRKVALFISFFNTIGNLLYVFPVFNWLPIVGRMLCGIPDGVKSAFEGKRCD